MLEHHEGENENKVWFETYQSDNYAAPIFPGVETIIDHGGEENPITIPITQVLKFQNHQSDDHPFGEIVPKLTECPPPHPGDHPEPKIGIPKDRGECQKPHPIEISKLGPRWESRSDLLKGSPINPVIRPPIPIEGDESEDDPTDIHP
jgi:hypothetical protein